MKCQIIIKKNKMEHRTFRISAVSVSISIIAVICAFNYFSLNSNNFYVKLLFKLSPLFFMLILIIFYMFQYKITLYSAIIFTVLFFCFLGDIFLSLYNPKLDDVSTNKETYIIIGGVSFFLSRLLLLLNFMLYRDNNLKIIHYGIKKMVICHVLFNSPFIALSVLFLMYGNYTMKYIFVFIYVLLGFGFQLSYSFLRIGEIEKESINSSIFGFIGMLLFNISDILLLTTMLTTYLPFYCIIISDNIYWIAMYFLTISIVRFSKENVEKGINYNFLNFY